MKHYILHKNTRTIILVFFDEFLNVYHWMMQVTVFVYTSMVLRCIGERGISHKIATANVLK